MATNNKYSLIIGLVILGLGMLLPTWIRASQQPESTDHLVSSPDMAYENGSLTISVHQQPLSTLLRRFYEITGISIHGLERRSGEMITFITHNEGIQQAIKRLFRQLKVTNYAFEFHNNQLSRVIVFPQGTQSAEIPQQRFIPQELPQPKKMVSAVKVENVVKGSQAESVGLEPGDLIISYDGVNINFARELVREVEKKSNKDLVDITVIRDGQTLTFNLNGGFIGINIRTVAIPGEQLAPYGSP